MLVFGSVRARVRSAANAARHTGADETGDVGEDAVLQRLLDRDRSFVVEGLRNQFGGLKTELGGLLGQLLNESDLVRRRVVSEEQLVDWARRLMVSAFLIPGRDP